MPRGNAPLPCTQRSWNTLARCVDEPVDWVSSITYGRRQMASYVCSWIHMTSTRPFAMIITRCPLQRKSLMSLHTLASSSSWMPTMDTGQLSSTSTPACLQHSTVPRKIPFPVASLQPHLFPRHLPEEDGSVP